MIERLNAALEGRYRLDREVGAGGMATVYLARDLRHDRQVAIKVMRPELAAVLGPDRFLAEIRTTAGLQHPHILALHDSGEVDGLLWYVMPYVEGESLRERLDREKQLPVGDAVEIAGKVASALQAAHDRGVVHRDVKPANILLGDGDEPLVADFGIALAVSAAGGGRLTETGLSLGTPHYMSPEQATGDRDPDARSDVYALGAVLYEMLVGDPPHTGSTAQAVVARILTEPAPGPAASRPSVPAHVDAAVRKALEKLPADRFASPAEFALALRDPAFRHGPPGAAGTARGPARRWRTVALAAAAAAALLAGGWAWSLQRPRERPLYHLEMSLEDVASFTRPDFDLSPDGSTVALIGVRGGVPAVYLRRLSRPGFVRVEGSVGAEGVAFSPDGRWVLFDRQPEGRLVMAPVEGGAPLDVHAPRGAPAVDPHWGANGEIAFVAGDTLWILDEPGGTPTPVADDLGGGRMPFLLPDGSVMVGGLAGVRMVDRSTGEVSIVINESAQAVYLESGHLVWGDAGGTLWAAPFDPRRRALTGSRISMLEGVSVSDDTRGFAVSRSGVLAANLGLGFLGTGTFTSTTYRMVGLDGIDTPLGLPPGLRSFPAFSPDGSRIAYSEVDDRTGLGVLWVQDLATMDRIQVSFTGDNRGPPLWSPDGTRLVFASVREGSRGADLYVTPVDNSRPDSLLLSRPGDLVAEQWLPDGRVLFRTGIRAVDSLYTLDSAGGQPVLYPGAAGQPAADPVRFPLGLQSTGAAVSPDGTLIAFVSALQDEPALYVREFPQPLGLYRASPRGIGGGYNPKWSPTGDTLYFWTRGAQNADSLVAAAVDRTSGVRIREPRTIHVTEYRGYDLHPDGRRFLVNDASTAAGRERFMVLVNWTDELRRRIGG